MKEIESLDFMLDIMSSTLVNPINYDTPAINAQMISHWSSYKLFGELSPEVLTANMPKEMSKRVLAKGKLVENHYFNQFLENIQNFFEDSGIPREVVLNKYIAGFGGHSRRLLQSAKQFSNLTNLTGRGMEALSFLPQDFTYLTTLFKKVRTSKPELLSEDEIKKYDFEILENNPESLKKITLTVSPITQGLKTTEANFYFYFGSLREIMTHTSDTIIDYKVNYDAATGEGEITAYYQENLVPFLPQRTQALKFLSPKIWVNKIKAGIVSKTLEDRIKAAKELVEGKNKETFKRDTSTGYHVNGMTLILKTMLDIIGAPDNIKRDGVLGGELHDSGKASTPDKVFKSTKKFSPLERKIMELHGVVGTLILLNSNIEEEKLRVDLANVVALTYLHHMPFNGENYYGFNINPNELPMIGRFSLVADIFHALLESRHYKDSYPIDQVVKNLDDWFPEDFFDPTALAILKEFLIPFFQREFKEGFTAEDINKVLENEQNGNKRFTDILRSLANGNLTQKEQMDLFAPTSDLKGRLKELRETAAEQPQQAPSIAKSRDLAHSYVQGLAEELRYLDMLSHVMEHKVYLHDAPETLKEFISINEKKRNSPNIENLTQEDREFLKSIRTRTIIENKEEIIYQENPLIIESLGAILEHTNEKGLEFLLFEEKYS